MRARVTATARIRGLSAPRDTERAPDRGGSRKCRNRILVAFVLGLLAVGSPAPGAVQQHEDGRFDHLVRGRDRAVIGVSPKLVSSLPSGDKLRQDWERIGAGPAGDWRVWIDDRSSLPALATLPGIAWFAGAGNELPPGPEPDLDALAQRAEAFLRDNPQVLGDWGNRIVLDRDGSGRRGPNVWQVRFAQVVDGVPVEGARYDFHVSHGNLVTLGATRWAPVRVSAEPTVSLAEAAVPARRVRSRHAGRRCSGPRCGGAAAANDRRRGGRIRPPADLALPLYRPRRDRHLDRRDRRARRRHRRVLRRHPVRAHQGPRESDQRRRYLPRAGLPGAGIPDALLRFHGRRGRGSVRRATRVVPVRDARLDDRDDAGRSVFPNQRPVRADLGHDHLRQRSGPRRCRRHQLRCRRRGIRGQHRRGAIVLLLAESRQSQGQVLVARKHWLENTQVQCNTNLGGGCNAPWNGSINMQGASGSCGNTGQLQDW